MSYPLKHWVGTQWVMPLMEIDGTKKAFFTLTFSNQNPASMYCLVQTIFEIYMTYFKKEKNDTIAKKQHLVFNLGLYEFLPDDRYKFRSCRPLPGCFPVHVTPWSHILSYTHYYCYCTFSWHFSGVININHVY